MIVRELTGGSYFGKKWRDEDQAEDVCRYTKPEIERVTRAAGRIAMQRQRRVTLVDKANVLETSRLWRAVAGAVMAREFPDVELDYLYVDAAAMHLISRPGSFDVMLTENMFGDILSDLGAGLMGGLGLAPSADIGHDNAVFQPCHGTAPDIAGKGVANPFAMILSAAMMLDWLGLRHNVPEMAADGARLRRAVEDGAEVGEGDGDDSIFLAPRFLRRCSRPTQETARRQVHWRARWLDAAE